MWQWTRMPMHFGQCNERNIDWRWHTMSFALKLNLGWANVNVNKSRRTFAVFSVPRIEIFRSSVMSCPLENRCNHCGGTYPIFIELKIAIRFGVRAVCCGACVIIFYGIFQKNEIFATSLRLEIAKQKYTRTTNVIMYRHVPSTLIKILCRQYDVSVCDDVDYADCIYISSGFDRVCVQSKFWNSAITTTTMPESNR